MIINNHSIGGKMMLEELREEVLRRLDISREVTDEEIWECIDEIITKKSREEYLALNRRSQLRKSIFASLRRLDILQELLDDDDITEIMVNGYQNIFVEKKGRMQKTLLEFSSKDRLADIIQQIAAKVNRRVNEASPIVDARLEDGSRVNIVLDPIAINGPIVTIRKFPKEAITMQHLIQWAAITQEAADMLREMVIAGYNIFICGGTGSGKTTFLNAMSNFIPPEERIITIEDSAELQIAGVENLVKMETRNATAEGVKEIRIRDLIKTSLRMYPNRIVLGEVRGEEAFDLLQAMGTGHDGSMSTGHGNNCKDMLQRLETMVLMGMDMPILAIRGQIVSAIDILVHLGKLRDKSRRVLEVAEVLPLENGEYKINTLYSFQERGEEKGKVLGELTGSRNRLKQIQKLKNAGIYWEEWDAKEK